MIENSNLPSLTGSSDTNIVKSKVPFRKKFFNIIFGKTIPQRILRIYLLTVVFGSLLLASPFCLNSIGGIQLNGYTNAGDLYNFWDAFFLSCSAFSSTGLTTVSIYDYLNAGGQVVIMLLMELGGLGLITIIFIIWNAFRKLNMVDLQQIAILQVERGSSKLGESFKNVRTAALFMLSMQIICAFLLSFCFCFIPAYTQTTYTLADGTQSLLSIDTDTLVPMYGDYAYSLWSGLFVSVSGANNGGMDIVSDFYSMAPYRNDLGVILQFITLFEFVIGGLGLPLIFDIIQKMKLKKHGVTKYKFSLFSKVALLSYVVVAVVGLIFAYSFEYGAAALNPDALNSIINCDKDGAFGQAEWFNKNWAIFYNTMSTRSCGFSTVNCEALSTGTKWTFIIMMFIGASPSSSGGGIRNTTFIIMIAAIWTMIRGKKEVHLFKKTISQETVNNSFVITIMAIIWVSLVSIIVFYSIPGEAQDGLVSSYFEVASAFGTVGLSVNITHEIKWWGLIFICLTMFIGQLGISNTLLSWTKKNPKGKSVHYPEEPVRIG